MSVFNIVKRNRKYFAATTDSGYKCKILIDSNSETLELGEQTLAVDDISVRSKYGTDLIFKLSASVEEQKDAGVCTLKTAFYNQVLVNTCRELGGKWDKELSTWVFPGFVSDEVEILDEKFNSPMVDVEITFNDSFFGDREPVYIAGFQIARATGRDSGARIYDGIAVIEGGATSSGSVKNWSTKIKEGTVIRMSVPELCIEDFSEIENLLLKVLS